MAYADAPSAALALGMTPNAASRIYPGATRNHPFHIRCNAARRSRNRVGDGGGIGATSDSDTGTGAAAPAGRMLASSWKLSSIPAAA